MSGIKCSTIELEKERKACQIALNKISILEEGIIELKKKTEILLKELPRGVKDSFYEDVKKITKWHTTSISTPAEGANSIELNKSVENLQKLKEQGQQVLCLLIELKGERREKKAMELTEKREILHSELIGMKTLFTKWRSEKYEDLNISLNNILPLIDSGEFIKTENILSQIEQKNAQLSEEAIKLEEQDKQRYHTLSALREVCKEMGWKEENLEVSNNPESAIIYKVKSYSAGSMTFHLSLQNIDVNSPLLKDVCYKDFNTLSDKLKKFGVFTKFERKDQSNDLPKLKARGELDIPDSAQEMEMER